MTSSPTSGSRFAPWALLLPLLVIVGLLAPATALAQSSDDATDRERLTAERYLQVLLRRPRPGVALDRVYGYHVQNDSLDDLESQLTAPDAKDDGGPQMVWGLIQLQRGRSADAATILAAAESKRSEDAACSFYLGRAYLAVGKTEQAAAAMERAIDRGPSRAEALPMFTELGRIYSRAGESEKSLAVWTRLEKLFPGDSRVGGQIARTLAEEGNYEEAKTRYEKLSNASQKADEKIAFAVQAAEMRRNMGESDEATELLEKILARLRPGSWLYTDVRNRIEAGFLKSGDYDALADYYQSQLNDRPDDLALRTRLSRIMITAGRLTEAKSLLETAISRAPDDGEARLTLIDVLVNQGDIAAAAMQFEELASRDSDNPDHLIRWGQILLEDAEQPLDQRRSAAASVWSRLAKARSDDAVTLSQIADMMRGIDRSEDAIDLYRQSIDLDPGAPQYREYLGEYLHSLDRKDEAIEVWKSIAAEDRRGRESLVRLAEVLGTFKLPDLALQAWKDASEFDLTFVQELRFAAKLSEAKQYDTALLRLDRAESLAETPDEHEQLLKDRIGVYQSSGTLAEQIQTVSAQPESVDTLRKLALMHGAAGDLLSAERSIRKAIELAPDRPEVLLIAADLAERQNRFSDAAELFTQLASADNRFRTNYLQRVSSLLVRLGQIDKALETCEAIIDANPASPESYMFYARTAFGASQDEEAIAALRRAMTVAPRDNAPRKMLAGHFADRYRTDEAIELYWQAFNFEPKTDDKIDLIRSLAPLYDRKADLDTLIGRIEEINRKDGDTRSANLMVAAAHESVQDFGAARSAIDQLLANQPRDITLLETMVRLSDAADEVELAAEYQQRITELANTPENRFKLVQYQLESGEIDVAQALSQRIAFLSDPSRLGTMVRSTAARGDLKTARAICQEVLRSDDSLWDIKLTLAQLLLMDRGGDDAEQTRGRAIELAREVRSAEIPMDAPAPTRRIQTTRRPTANQLPANYLSNPMYWSQSSYQIAQTLQIGPYANSNYAQRTSTIEPTSFGHARVIAASLILMNEVIDKTGDEAMAAIEQKLETEFSLPDILTTTDAVDLWEQFALMNVASLVTNNANRGPFGATPANLTGAAKAKAEETKKRQMEMMWRLAEIDSNYGVMPLLSMLAQRLMSNAAPAQQKPDMTPLSEDHLVRLAKLNERIQKEGFQASAMLGATSGTAEMMMQSILGHEFKLAGMEERAAEFSPDDPDDDADYDTINGAIQFYLRLNEFDKAGNLVARLLPAARREKSQILTQGFSPSIQIMLSGNESAKDFFAQHQAELIDAVIARWSKQTTNTAQRSTTLGDGYVNTYTQYGGGYRSVRVRGPLSPRLMDSALVQQVLVYAKTPENANTLNSQTPKLELTAEVIKHLESPLEGASADEEKTRRVIAAYAHWWSDRPDKCYESLVKLCEDFSADVDLQIERARLASELKQPRVALETLDSFNPLDSRMLVRKEMAAMNLAAEIGDTDRAKVAAERLFGMRLDVQMQLALADQLKRLGLNDQATAMLNRTRSGRVRDENTELQIARAFLAADDKDSAAEVAYALMRRLSSGRSGNNNSSYYQQQVASILQSAGRLEPLIERAKRRVESSPKAIRPKQELAELYTAAGRTDEANQVWETISKDAPSGAPQLLARAEALVKARKHKEAVKLYLDAFEKDSNRFNNDFYRLYNAVQSAGDDAADEMFRRLMKFPIDRIPTYRMDELARLGSRNELSDAKRDFIGYLLKSPAAKTQIYSIVGNLSEEHRAKIPEYRDAMIASICSDDAFVASSTIWQVRSRSSGGRAIGPLADAVSLLQKDDEAQKQFRKSATKALENEAHRLNAQFLLALVDSNQPDKLESSLASMRDCIKRDPDEKSNTETVSSGLLWQAGQILEAEENVPVDFLVDLYEEAKRSDPMSSGSGPEYTLDSRLVDTYIKAERFDDARQRLLDLFRGVDFSEQNQFNPGYGDYQQLQAAGWVAEKLLQCNAPIDSLIIYRGQLSDPGSFERAQRWGGGRDRKIAFETGAEKAAEKINAEVAVAHLDRQIGLWEKDLDASPVDLMECSSQTITTTETPSSLELAIRIAVGDEKTRAQVIEFQQRVEKLSKSNDESWELAALNLMTGCFLGSDQTTELANTLFERLPDAAEFKPAQDPDSDTISDAVKAESLFDLYPIARAASRSESESNQQIGKRLVNYISAVAESSHDSSIALALAQISGDVSESISRILDVIQSQTKPDAALPESTVNQCLQVAKDAANAGQIDTTVRALKLALQNGPPLRKISNSGDAFAISTSPNYSGVRNSNDQNAMDELISKVSEITIALSQASGVPLRFNDQDSPPKANGKINPDSFSEIADAYLAILAPTTRGTTVFSYAQPIASRSYDRFSPSENLVVASASTALALAAAKAGRAEEIFELIEKRIEKQKDDQTDLSITLVQLAVATRQPEQLERSIDRFTKVIDSRLPEPGKRISVPGQVTSISSQMASESQRKSEVINHVLHAIWPIIATDKMWKPADEDAKRLEASFAKVASLMLRTENLINSDSYTANRHREIKRRLAEKQVAIAKAYGNIQVIDDYIKSQLDQIETQAYPSGSNIEDYKRRALESLTTKLIDDGLIEQMDPVFRQGIATHSARKRNYSSRFESQCCLAISQLPPDKRLELLSKITFGRSGQEPLAYFDALVSYEVPPPLVARQHPMLDAVVNLETSTQHYPVVNSYLMLIDAAAAVGQTDAIRQQLLPQKKTAGDEADIALALLDLAAAKSNDAAGVLPEIRPTLDAVAANLANNLPKQNDKDLPFPAMESHLIIRAFQSGMPVNVVKPLIQNVKTYAIRGQRNFIVSAVARATSQMGIGRAARATADSPLEHFHIVSLPARNRGDNPRLQPLYAVAADGWISGTSGYEQTHLMFKYPVTGSFTISANIEDGGWGESDIAYGGVIFQANGWQQTAKVLGMGNRGQVEFKVASIQRGKVNEEAVSVSPENVQGVCNGQSYVTDLPPGAFPFASLHHHKYRTTRFRDLRFTGNPTIPDEVNLIDPSMRGWGVLTRGRSIPKMLMPIGPKQNKEQILSFRKKMTEDLAKGPLVGGWSVRENQLHFKSRPGSTTSSDPANHIEYLRPFQDGESIEIEFYWKKGETEFAPTVGRTILKMSDKGTTPDWIMNSGDLASVGFIDASRLDPPYELIAADNVPKEDDWNNLVMKRTGDQVTITLNGKPLAEVPVAGHERPGIYRNERRDLIVRTIRLTGDWPDEFPAELIAD